MQEVEQQNRRLKKRTSRIIEVERHRSRKAKKHEKQRSRKSKKQEKQKAEKQKSREVDTQRSRKNKKQRSKEAEKQESIEPGTQKNIQNLPWKKNKTKINSPPLRSPNRWKVPSGEKKTVNTLFLPVAKLQMWFLSFLLSHVKISQEYVFIINRIVRSSC